MPLLIPQLLLSGHSGHAPRPGFALALPTTGTLLPGIRSANACTSCKALLKSHLYSEFDPAPLILHPAPQRTPKSPYLVLHFLPHGIHDLQTHSVFHTFTCYFRLPLLDPKYCQGRGLFLSLIDKSKGGHTMGPST